MTNNTAVAPYEPKSFGELESFCKRITNTGMVPQAYRGKPDEAAVAIVFGKEIGLPAMTSLQFVAVINGRPGIYGDALPGLAMNKGLIADMREHFEGEPFQDGFCAVCQVARPNGTVVEQRFSVADAKRAGLWEKQGPWKQYPRRMLQWRARGWAIRDAAPHALFGMTAEELHDIDIAELPRGPETARDITPETPSKGPRAAAEAAMADAELVEPLTGDERADPLRIANLSAKESVNALQQALSEASAAEADRLFNIYRARIETWPQKVQDGLANIVSERIAAEFGGTDAPTDQGELV